MKRILNFILGLWIFVVVGVLLFLFIDSSTIRTYQDDLLQYSWFNPTLYWVAGALLVFSLFIIFWSFRPSYKSRGLLLSYSDGDIFINKKSIEKTVLHTVQKYDGVRQSSVNTQLFQKKKSSYIDITVELFVIQTDNIQSYLQEIREDIKKTTENFAELPVREVTLNIKDQKSLNKRVL